jgi:hypothetical protein
LSKNFSGSFAEILLINCVVFLVDKELSAGVGFLFGITGLLSIKMGLGVFGTWGNFSVFGGFFFWEG